MSPDSESTKKDKNSIDNNNCKERTSEEIQATHSYHSTESLKRDSEPDLTERYTLHRENRANSDDDGSVSYLINREVDGTELIQHPLHISTISNENDDLLRDEVCEIHAQEKGACSVSTPDVVDNCFTYATDVVSSAVDGFPDFNIFPSIISYIFKGVIYLQTHPTVSTTLFILLCLWWIWSRIDFCFSLIIANLVNILNPWVHSIAVALEQLFRRGFHLASYSQEVWESFYCDFSIKWCQQFKLMCNVTCSHLQRTLERARRA